MSTSIVQTATGGSLSDGLTQVCTFGSNVRAGSIIALFAGAYGSSGGVSSIADTRGNVYSILDDTRLNNSGGALAYTYSVTGGANTITVTWTTSQFGPLILAWELSGVHPITPLDNNQHIIASGTSSGADTATSGNLITTFPNAFVIAGGFMNGPSVLSAGTGYSNLFSVANASYTSSVAYGESLIKVVPGVQAGLFTPSIFQDWVVGAMAFNSAGKAYFNNRIRPRSFAPGLAR